MRGGNGASFIAVLIGVAGIVGSSCGGSSARKDSGAAADVPVGLGGVTGTGGLSTAVGRGGAGGLATLSGTGGAARGGTGGTALGGAGGTDGGSTALWDASLPDVPLPDAPLLDLPGTGGGFDASPGFDGAAAGGEVTSQGGATAVGGATGMGGGTGTGGSTGTGGATLPVPGPCDIYATGNTPCVAAYSMVRVLSSGYAGPLYQVRKGGGSQNPGTGGTIQDIGARDGYADSAAQDAFCGSSGCTVARLYDQSGEGNDLTVAKKGCYPGTASEDDYESSATRRSLTVGGHKVYALYMNSHEGYRNNQTRGMPTSNTAQGIYAVVDGRRYGTACCWDFGNASTNNCNTSRMDALFFGGGLSTSGTGPWFRPDFGAGPWFPDCGAGAPESLDCNPPVPILDYAMGMLKTSAARISLKFGNAQSGALTIAYDGSAPFTIASLQGGIILGIGQDNSNGSQGTFFEGVITSGRPSDASDAEIFKNVQAAGYGL